MGHNLFQVGSIHAFDHVGFRVAISRLLARHFTVAGAARDELSEARLGLLGLRRERAVGRQAMRVV